VVRRCCAQTPRQIVAEVFADLDHFNLERFDDQTLIIMRVKAKSGADPMGAI